MPMDAHEKDEVFVGRLRRDESQPNTLNMWIVSDNLRKGAATNAVQIAEYMVKKGLLKQTYIEAFLISPGRNISACGCTTFYFFGPFPYKHLVITQPADIIRLRMISIPAMFGTVAIIDFAFAFRIF